MYREEVADLNEVRNTLSITLREHALCNYEGITDISPHRIQHRHETLGRHMCNDLSSLKQISIFKRPTHSESKWAIIECVVIPDRKTE